MSRQEMFKMGYENVSSCFFITFCWQVDVDKTAISVFIVRIKPTFPKCLEVFGPLVFRTYYLCCSHCAPKVYCLLLAQHFTTFTGGKKTWVFVRKWNKDYLFNKTPAICTLPSCKNCVLLRFGGTLATSQARQVMLSSWFVEMMMMVIINNIIITRIKKCSYIKLSS